MVSNLCKIAEFDFQCSRVNGSRVNPKKLAERKMKVAMYYKASLQTAEGFTDKHTDVKLKNQYCIIISRPVLLFCSLGKGPECKAVPVNDHHMTPLATTR